MDNENRQSRNNRERRPSRKRRIREAIPNPTPQDDVDLLIVSDMIAEQSVSVGRELLDNDPALRGYVIDESWVLRDSENPYNTEDDEDESDNEDSEKNTEEKVGDDSDEFHVLMRQLRLDGSSISYDASDMLSMISKISSRSFLPLWSLQNNISHKALQGLMQGLRKIAADVNDRIVKLIIATDGAPLDKSSARSIWPILCSYRGSSDVFIVGVFIGHSKPEDANEFLRPMVDELIHLIHHGVDVQGQNNAVRTVCLPAGVGTPRTDEGFRQGKYFTNPRNDKFCDPHQKKESILVHIPGFGPVTDVVIDPMHQVYLGSGRKILGIWMSTACEASTVQIKAISDRLVSFKDHMTYDFARRPRSLQFLPYFEATELRTTLLYTAAVACAGILPEVYHRHFLLSHVTLTILNRVDLCGDEETLQYADGLLKRFVDEYETLFGSKFLAYNFHLSLHVDHECRKYGTLNEFSAFRFENYIRIMRSLVRKGDQPLQQLMRRYAEIDALNAKCAINRSADWCHQNEKGPKMKHNGHPTQEVLRLDKFTLNCKDGKNGCVLVDAYEHGNNVGEIVVECECITKSTDGEFTIHGKVMEIENLRVYAPSIHSERTEEEISPYHTTDSCIQFSYERDVTIESIAMKSSIGSSKQTFTCIFHNDIQQCLTSRCTLRKQQRMFARYFPIKYSVKELLGESSKEVAVESSIRTMRLLNELVNQDDISHEPELWRYSALEQSAIPDGSLYFAQTTTVHCPHPLPEHHQPSTAIDASLYAALAKAASGPQCCTEQMVQIEITSQEVCRGNLEKMVYSTPYDLSGHSAADGGSSCALLEKTIPYTHFIMEGSLVPTNSAEQTPAGLLTREADTHPRPPSVQTDVKAGPPLPMMTIPEWHPRDFFNRATRYPAGFPDLKSMIDGEEINERGFRSLYANEKVNDQVINGMAVIMARGATERGYKVTVMPTFLSSALIVDGKQSIGLRTLVRLKYRLQSSKNNVLGLVGRGTGTGMDCQAVCFHKNCGVPKYRSLVGGVDGDQYL
ncbi:hypothetical protein QAD02_003303 [Eretmocerus hayati]|uniref:Uncharacterized protein n=1 Tax=Eretmocerus hayati TaxID=131215 RepID=A0ACC2NLS1_9HYME|nr:hypothetical protein QAD02_003303 [Eretmocerus hayati]